MTGLTPRSRDYMLGPTRRADHYLYRCFDADGLLIYIGCTANVDRRIAAHRRASGQSKASRWLSVCMATYVVEGPFAGRESARAAEHAAIQSEQPLFNYQCRNDVGVAAWMTRRPIAQYLVERGHLELAVETVCTCRSDSSDLGVFDAWCFAHTAAQVAGITDLVEYDPDVHEDRDSARRAS